MNSVRIIVAAICLFYAFSMTGQTNHLTLTIGESIDITLGADDVTVSRKGVIDLFHRGGQRWTLTGLKRGFVLIKSQALHYKITVVDHATGAEPLSQDLCTLPQAKCSDTSIEIGGSFVQARQFYMLMARCQEIVSCKFTATLAPSAAGEVEDLLRQKPAPGNNINHIQTYCTESLDPYDAYPGWLRPFLKIDCRAPEYRVDAHFISLTDTDLRRLGFSYSSKALGVTGIGDLSLKQIIDAKLIAQRQLVAMPTLDVMAGNTAKVHAGGEFFVAGSNPEHTGSWKKFGMQLSFAVEPYSDDVKLRYELQMTGRGTDASLTGNRTESSVVLPPGEERLVAQVPFYVAQYEENGSALLSQVPIIGPLFKATSTLSDVRQLFVYFKITPKNQIAPSH